jgi:hypothetical protein
MLTTHRDYRSITVTTGYGVANTYDFKGGMFMQVIAQPPTQTNIYDLYILDQNNQKIYTQLAREGNWEEHGLHIPVRGVYAITLSSATVDEVVPVTFMVQE